MAPTHRHAEGALRLAPVDDGHGGGVAPDQDGARHDDLARQHIGVLRKVGKDDRLAGPLDGRGQLLGGVRVAGARLWWHPRRLGPTEGGACSCDDLLLWIRLGWGSSKLVVHAGWRLL